MSRVPPPPRVTARKRDRGWILNDLELLRHGQQRAVWPLGGRLPEIRAMRHGTSNGSACAVTMSPSGHKYSYQSLLPTTALYQDLCQPAVTLSSLSLSFTHTHTLLIPHTHTRYQSVMCVCVCGAAKFKSPAFLHTLKLFTLWLISICPFSPSKNHSTSRKKLLLHAYRVTNVRLEILITLASANLFWHDFNS